MTEQEIRQNFSKNLINLRKAKNLTQLGLADKLNYSDKSISKWERGDVMPDIVTIKMIADFFGVSVDKLISGDATKKISQKTSRILITLLSCVSVFFVATVVALFYTEFVNFDKLWMFYVFCLPIVSILTIVFCSKWFGVLASGIAVSSLVWALGINVYLIMLEFFMRNVWFVFVVCAAFQIVVVLWFLLVHRANKNKKMEDKK